MRLEKLEAGMTIANYRRLCELLDEPERSGDSKKAQLKEWKRYFDFKRRGNAYIVTEIYNDPKPKADRRMVYMQFVEGMLLRYLSQWCRSGRRVEHTFRVWCVEIGLASERAYDNEVAEEYHQLISTGVRKAEPAFSTIAIQKARYEITSFVKTALIRAASALAKNRIIDVASVDYVVENLRRRKATSEEVSYIADAKRRVLSSMQLKSMFSVNMSPRKQKEFYERLHAIYRAERGWSKTYTLYAIEILDDEAVMRYADIDVAELRDSFRHAALESIWKKLADEADKGEQRMLEAFCRMEEGDASSFFMTRMLAEDVRFLVGEML